MGLKNRILFMGESITLAHVVRPAQLAESLDADVFEVHFATDSRYQKLFCPANATFHAISCMSGTEFQRRLDRGTTVFDEILLEMQIKEDLELFQKVKPDVVVGDFRNSLAISARLKGIPYLGIANAYWSHFNNEMMPLPEILPFRLIGHSLSQFIFEKGRKHILPWIFTQQAAPMNKIRQKYGFKPLKYFMDCYLEADLIGFADAYEVVNPNPNFKRASVCLGPLVGNFKISLPTWWNEIKNDHPVIYLNFGSSGNPHLIPDIIEELTKKPVQLIVGYNMKDQEQIEVCPSGARIFNGGLLPGDLICQKSDLVINNGGSGGGYQALMAGKPMIGITKNMDQMLNMHFMAQRSFVREIPNWNCSATQIAETVNLLVSNEIETQKAREFAAVLTKYQNSYSFNHTLEQLLKLKSTKNALDL